MELLPEHEEFLNKLRSSGADMFSARPQLREQFPELSATETFKIIVTWLLAQDTEPEAEVK